jgi:transposase InsO family protein
MLLHANAKLGPAGRLALVEAIERGLTLKAAAAAFNVAPATAHRWWHRYVASTDKASGSWARDRSSRPHRQPRRLTPQQEQVIIDARLSTNLGPGRLAGILQHARSTIWKVLHRHGLSRRPRGERQTFKRYEWSRPGALLHVDVKRLARFQVAGNREMRGQRVAVQLNRGVGYEYLHCVVDDHSRLAYVELHQEQTAPTAARVLRRAILWFNELGLAPPDAVMTDGALVYKSNDFKQALDDAGAHHIATPPYTPRWNGKVERFIQTLQNEWAYAHRWNNSTQRARSLQSFLRYYNRRRPHSSLADRPPISRVHNLCGQDI